MKNRMNDIRTQLPDCPLRYAVPDIPSEHTALVIPVREADIAWQEKLLPWTLASLINNTDIVLHGVRLFIHCTGETLDRVHTALSLFDLPDGTILRCTSPILNTPQYQHYDKVCFMDLNYWAFRGLNGKGDPEIKLPLGHTLRYNWGWGVADYNQHAANTIMLKNEWVRSEFRTVQLTDPDSAEGKSTLAKHLLKEGARARWLHAANLAVYGEHYEKRNETVAGYFFNESDPNWHLDASFLCIPSVAIPKFREWCEAWESKLGSEACIGLYLLKTGQHAYNFKDSLMIEDSTDWDHQLPDPHALRLPAYPRLCTMKNATKDGFLYAMHQLMGAQLGMKV